MDETEEAGDQLPKREPVFAKGAWKRFIILAICLGAPYLFRDQIFEALDTISSQIKLPSTVAGLASGPDFKVTHECMYLDPTATQCWNYLKIISLNDQPITIKDVIVNERKECTPDSGIQAFATLMASQYMNVNNKTIKKGDAYALGVTCEPVDVQIITDKGNWNGGSKG